LINLDAKILHQKYSKRSHYFVKFCDRQILTNLTTQTSHQHKNLHSKFMEIIRWMRVILSSIFILLGLGFGTYFYIKEHPITSIDPQGCIVRLSPADDFTIIPFGDRRCPKD